MWYKSGSLIKNGVKVDTTDASADGDDAVLVEAPDGAGDMSGNTASSSAVWCLKFDQLQAILFDESSIYNFFQKQTDISQEAERILKSVICDRK